MGELNKREMIIRYGALGLTLGCVILLSIYVLLFQSVEEHFEFRVMGSLHRPIWFLFIYDSIPLVSASVGALLGNWRFRQMNAYAIQVQSETEMNQEIHYPLLILSPR